jgi:CRP-like cAMP-binding protein
MRQLNRIATGNAALCWRVRRSLLLLEASNIMLQSLTKNSLLAAMTAADYALLVPDLIRIPLPLLLQLQNSDTAIDRVYFPEDGIASIIAVNAHGKEVEVGLFGRDGMSSTAAVLGADRSSCHAYMRVAGASGLRLPTSTLRQAMSQSETLRTLLLHYAQTMMTQLATSAVAAASQTIDQRLARLLLMCDDRLGGGGVHLTHESISMLLGTRRAGITVAMRDLKSNNLISGQRSNVIIRDRYALEKLAGDSYGFAEEEYHRLIGTVLRGGQTRAGADLNPLAVV